MYSLGLINFFSPSLLSNDFRIWPFHDSKIIFESVSTRNKTSFGPLSILKLYNFIFQVEFVFCMNKN
jgi:hypothetical protein